MTQALIRKLEAFTALSEAEKAAVLAAPATVRQLEAREDLTREGDHVNAVNVLLTGFALRYKTLADGRRQIVSIIVPGDFCDLRAYLLGGIDYSLAAVTTATVGIIPRERLDQLVAAHPRLRDALTWCGLVEEAIAREWILNVGQRTALERAAHLFCELFHRLRAVGLTRGKRCELPLTQTELGEAMGLSAVHVNRTVQELRRLGLISLEGRELTIHDLPMLEAAALFSPAYLHLAGRSAERLQRA
jgi:CRP-like cAMP-binding protein